MDELSTFQEMKKRFPRLTREHLHKDLTPCELGRILGTSDSSIRRWTRMGRFPAWETPGGHLRFRWIRVYEALEHHGEERQPA